MMELGASVPKDSIPTWCQLDNWKCKQWRFGWYGYNNVYQISEFHRNFQSVWCHFLHFCLKDLFECVLLPCKISDCTSQYIDNFSYAIQVCQNLAHSGFWVINLPNFTGFLLDWKACQPNIHSCFMKNEFLNHLKDRDQLE